MCEEYEFTHNIDEILAVPGVDAVNFGPIDYSLSKSIPIGYDLSQPDIAKAFDTLVRKAKPKNIGIMCPVVPPTKENIEKVIKDGINMVILGNDMYHFQNACRSIMHECVEPAKKGFEASNRLLRVLCFVNSTTLF